MKKIKIFEMGPRDGLQSIKEIISSEKKNTINKSFTIYRLNGY